MTISKKYLVGVLKKIKNRNETILNLTNSVNTDYAQGYYDGQKEVAVKQNNLIDVILKDADKEENKANIEINKPFTTLLSTLNALVQTLNVLGYRLYDVENEDFYIKKIVYDGSDDKVKFECDEENANQLDTCLYAYKSEYVKSFLPILNTLLETLNALEYRLYDTENKDYFINEFIYDGTDNKVKFKVEEEK